MLKCFFRYINSKKHIRSVIGPLKDNAGNLVTDDQSIPNMLNKYFSSVFNTTSGGDNIDSNVINANVETINALHGQDATTEPSENNNDNRNGSVSNNKYSSTDKIASKIMY